MHGQKKVWFVGSHDEVKIKDLKGEELQRFHEADTNEWVSMVKSGFVRILSQESENCRRRYPDRVLSPRMVRRWKGQEGTFAPPKAKSRWCARGHQDLDLGKPETYAPTPKTETIMCFLVMVQSFRMELSVADCKNAFCQSSALRRPAGHVFVEPCSEVPLPKNGLVELIAPVYGLSDAPLLWQRTLAKRMIEKGFRKYLLDPCLYVRRGGKGKVADIVLIDVDDLANGAFRGSKPREEFTSRLVFGKLNDERQELGLRRPTVAAGARSNLRRPREIDLGASASGDDRQTPDQGQGNQAHGTGIQAACRSSIS